MNDAPARSELLALMSEREFRPIHVQHVTRLALQLFDALVELHGLGARERLLLEAASYLHDIGHCSESTGLGHHHESARLIREHAWQYFDPAEVEIIAQVARYHRKSMPEVEHEEFRALGDRDRRVVQRLAALLRLADSLDRTHQQLVRSISVELPVNRILLRLEAAGPILREVQAAIKKGDLAMAVFQRDLVFMVGDEIIIPPEPSPE
jgi:exopolyphosphatase / guanosine-5'-triphosphate,3'-diphosphate pyrophosphatase